MFDKPFPVTEDLVVFLGDRRVGDGARATAARAAWRAQASNATTPMTVLDRRTGRVVDLDLRGSEDEVVARHTPPPSSSIDAEPAQARRGRPKLGVTAREVTLLPRHWDWLATQPGGASASLRRLVEAARKADGDGGDRRARVDATYRFASVMAGDRPGFEEAMRALYAGDRAAFEQLASAWPKDIADEALRILGDT